MGFGILAIGSALLLFETLGADCVGYITMCYGCFLLSYHFRLARVSCYALIPVSLAAVVRTMTRFGLFALGDTVRAVIEIVVFAGMTVAITFLLSPVADFARKNGGHRLSGFLSAVRYIAVMFYLFATSLLIFSGSEYAANFTQMFFILKYVLIVVYIVCFFYCYTSVTTPSLTEKEKREDEEYEKKEAARKQKMRKFMGREGDSGDEKK